MLSSRAVGAVELTTKTFDDVVYNSGKGTFIKFLAPWWGHCKKMKPDWDKLADKFKDSDVVTIADVDCTAEGEALCKKIGVQGYPTIKYWLEGNRAGKDYNGGRSYSDLEKFTQKTFAKPCDVTTQEHCSEEEKTYLDSIKDKDAAKERGEKEKLLEEKKTRRKDMEEDFQAKKKAMKKEEKALKKEINLLNKLVKAKKGKDEL